MEVWWIVPFAIAVCIAIGVWYVVAHLVVKIQVGPVPIRSEEIPVEATVLVDGSIDVDVEVPIDAVLTGADLGLDHLTVPVDTLVLVEDEIAIETTVDIETTISSVLGINVPVKGTVPVKTKVPLRHKVRVKDSVTLALGDLRLPLRAIVPLSVKVPIRQPIHVKGKVSLDGAPVRLGSIQLRSADVKLGLE
jgi:hypothetical protein